MHNTPPCSSVGEISKEFCLEHERQSVRTLSGVCARGVMLVILKITPALHPDGAPNLAAPTSQLMWSGCADREGFWDWEGPSSDWLCCPQQGPLGCSSSSTSETIILWTYANKNEQTTSCGLRWDDREQSIKTRQDSLLLNMNIVWFVGVKSKWAGKNPHLEYETFFLNAWSKGVQRRWLTETMNKSLLGTPALTHCGQHGSDLICVGGGACHRHDFK